MAELDTPGRVALALLLGLPIVILLGAYGPIILGLLVGVVIVWRSTAWKQRDKVIATVGMGILFVLPPVLALVMPPRIGMGILVLILIWPLAGFLVGGFLWLVRIR